VEIIRSYLQELAERLYTFCFFTDSTHSADTVTFFSAGAFSVGCGTWCDLVCLLASGTSRGVEDGWGRFLCTGRGTGHGGGCFFLNRPVTGSLIPPVVFRFLITPGIVTNSVSLVMLSLEVGWLQLVELQDPGRRVETRELNFASVGYWKLVFRGVA
jgi:hypothetical protein